MLFNLQIESRVREMAAEMECPDLLLMVATGGVIFGADLLRALYAWGKDPLVGVCSCKSYGMGQTPGPPVVSGLQGLGVEGKRVLVVDDVLDTGVSLKAICRGVIALGADAVETAVLVDKCKSGFVAGHIGFKLPGCGFLVGYGMDDKGHKRGMGDIMEVASD